MKYFYWAGVLTLVLSSAQGQYYNIDFQTPDQPVNHVVQTGAAPDHVSRIWFGTPMVVPSYGALTNQPLLFDSIGEPWGSLYYYTQVQLNLVQSPFVDVAFDFVDVGAGHRFTLLFDTPHVRNFYFDNGQISFERPSAGVTNIGTYAMGVDYRFDIHIDYALNQWTFMENSAVLASGIFNADDYVHDFRFNYSADSPGISGTAIDNVVVTVPEPTVLGAMVMGAAVLLLLMHLDRRKKD